MNRILLLVLGLALALGGWFWFQNAQELTGVSESADVPQKATAPQLPPQPPSTQAAVQSTRSYLDEQKRLELFDLEHADLLLGRAIKPFVLGLKAHQRLVVSDALDAGFSFVGPVLPRVAVGPGDYRFEALKPAAALNKQAFLVWVDELHQRFKRITAISFGRDRNSPEILSAPSVRAQSGGWFRIAGLTHDGGPAELTGRFELTHAGLAHWKKQTVPRPPFVGFVHGLELTQVRWVASKASLFEDTTRASGIDATVLGDNWKRPNTEPVIFPGGVALGDVDADGDWDVVLSDVGQVWLYLNNGDATFEKQAWSLGLRADVKPHLAVFDATGDGKAEVFVAGRFHRYSKEQGQMVPVEGAYELPNANVALADYDGDGLIDMYMTNSGARSPKHVWESGEPMAFFDNERITGQANHLFRNLGGGRFEDVTPQTGASPGFGRTFAAAWLYINDDQYPDLFGANDFGRNVLLLSNGKGGFVDAPDVDPLFGGFSMGVSAGDLDGDGLTDLYVSNMYSKAGHRVYHHLDLAVYPKDVQRMLMHSLVGNRYYRSRGDGTFEDLSEQAGVHRVGWGWSGALADLDLDGRLDMYAPSGYISSDRNKPDG